MEKTATKSTKKKDLRGSLKKAFIEQVLTEEKRPKSVFAFAKEQKISEAEFYDHFNSLNTLEQSIWSDWFEDVKHALSKDTNYSSFSLREKLLSLYFTWFEMLLRNRSYVIYEFEEAKKEIEPGFLGKMKTSFHEFVDEMIVEGIESGEIKKSKLSTQYAKAFWVQFLFVSKFWLNDESENFQKTDAAIEKSVNLAFDFLGTGPVDRLIDFAKFLYQNQRPF